MRIGLPTEIKPQEDRVGLTPAGVRELVDRGHQVCVQEGAGRGAGFNDNAYSAAGARMAESADDVFAETELVVKVKEPQPEEYARLSSDQVLFAFLHLGVCAVETV